MGSRPAAWEPLLSHLKGLNTNVGNFGGPSYSQQRRLGEDLFGEFCNLGLSLRANNETVKETPSSLVSPVIQAVKHHQRWIEDFVSIYGTSEIDLEGAVPTASICKVRSGVQFLLDNFSGVSSDFDAVLKSLRENGEVNQFDSNLKVWIDGGFRHNLQSQSIPVNVPKEHWWWF